MGIQEWLRIWRGDNRVQDVAEAVAQESVDVMWDRLTERMAHMELPEIRGYVRARTRATVKLYAQQSVRASQEVPDALLDRVVTLALDEVVRLTMARLLAPPAQVPAAGTAPVRKAA